MRNIILLCAALSVVIFSVYKMGKWNGAAECEKNAALQFAAANNKIETLRNKINEKANKTPADDIRGWLRANYTIGD
jgi:hypothetical protein